VLFLGGEGPCLSESEKALRKHVTQPMVALRKETLVKIKEKRGEMGRKKMNRADWNSADQ
jgi:hypothetical protein